MRFLCLHGLGTSSEILQVQTASLRYLLGEDQHQFEFVGGALAWPPAKGIPEVFGEHMPCYSYFDGTSAQSIRAAVEGLRSYIQIRGPFDGVLGFSQGAVLAATLIIQEQAEQTEQANQTDNKSQDRGSFIFAIFVCGNLPFQPLALSHDRVSQIEPTSQQDHSMINIPTVNCWARNDSDFPGMGPPLSQVCMPQDRIDVIHTAGHGFPNTEEETLTLVEAIRRMADQFVPSVRR